MPANAPILHFGIVPFFSPRQRPQQLALQWSRQVPVVYVEPHRSLATAVRTRQWSSPSATEPVPAGLTIVDPPPVLPFSGHLPGVNALNYGVTARRLRRFLTERHAMPPRCLVVNFPKQADALRWFPGIPFVYDVMDDYPLFYRGRQAQALARWHEQLLQTATAVVVSSHTLAERCRPFAKTVHCISNGVDERFVHDCLVAPPAAAIAELPGPRLGYVGSISAWFDFAVVRQLAAAFPQGSIILVGPVDVAPPPLPPNVHFLGPRRHCQLPGILKAFDLGLVPFRVLPSIDAVNPVKVYEYFAAGLPVLSSAFREIRPFEPLLTVCTTADDWSCAACRLLAQRPTAQIIAQQRAVARGNLWSAKAAAILALINEIIVPRTRANAA